MSPEDYQLDVIRNEIIPKYVTNAEETGIIAPYNNQVTALEKEFQDIDVATVHKFQGREKDTIIISTVDDEITDFADVSFDMRKDGKDEECSINIEDFIKIISGLNELFSKLAKEVSAWAEDNKKTDYPYYKKITRFDFIEFNELYNCDVLKRVGKILHDF